MEKKSKHPQWAIEHRKPCTELKLIGGKYYLYEVKSIYDKKTKKSKKISLGIIGRTLIEKPIGENEDIYYLKLIRVWV